MLRRPVPRRKNRQVPIPVKLSFSIYLSKVVRGRAALVAPRVQLSFNYQDKVRINVAFVGAVSKLIALPLLAR
ncbi:hypothetical protein EMIT047CA2_220039 [Pseudomonas soli]